MAWLLVEEGMARGFAFQLLPGETTIGRSPQADLVISDREVSRVHAAVRETDEGGYRIEDRSRNGLLLNGVPLEGAEALRDGDALAIGESRLRFALELPQGSDDPTRTDGREPTTPASAPARPRRALAEPLLLGTSGPMRELQRRLRLVAPRDVTVLVLGESGTGKEVVARAVHRSSARRDGPFVAVNAARWTGELLQSELFGHERGAFTGATTLRVGRFEQAHRGTLFLDEVGELSLEAQAALLRVLEERSFHRLGGSRLVEVDVRLIAATNRDLEAWVRDGRFREDLYYRLHVVELRLPPLRERREDIGLLARHFLESVGREVGGPPRALSEDALEALREGAYRGNVRELRNLIERLLIFASGATIERADIDAARGALDGGSTPAIGDLALTLEALERAHIERLLERVQGNKTRAAAALGIDRRTLYGKLERLGLR